MGRTNLKIDTVTKEALDECKQDGETWDECLRRLAQLDRATRVGRSEDVFEEYAWSAEFESGEE